ncbi:plexin domain-containing protein 2 [Cylas formicarius]|uniref:plexin domain-containing protein 2 n=1 Tax=Cylas formicarius TaxID=197179 RepID=UPI0029585339|nr:plexin domain-containing protein 2 [Cylas formicarius]
MARYYYFLCAELSLWIVPFLALVSYASTSKESLYLTEPTHRRSEYSLALELLDDKRHSNQKRDTEVENLPHENTTSLAGNTTTPIVFKKQPTETPPSEAINITESEKFAKNLGVNGSGQRKDVSQPPHVPLKSDTNLSPDILHGNVVGSFDATLLGDLDEDDINKILAGHNITSTKMDNHLFYNSTIYVQPKIGQTYWVDLNNCSNVKVSDLLSNSHRRAATIKLSFEFPFYGHLIKNITIATGGFLYTGNFVHYWLAATQYIAPLMANFDTSLSNNSLVRYCDNGTAFTVEWQRVVLQDTPSDEEFTFQVTLFDSGDIVFVYKNVPLLIEQIKDSNHPVKIGLSDAYIMDETIYLIRRKTIYEYHRVAFKKEDIKNWTAIYLRALPTCLGFRDCSTCLTNEIAETHQCTWCPKLQQCSTGYDRNRQDWLDNGCNKTSARHGSMCVRTNEPYEPPITTAAYDSSVENRKMGVANPASHLGTSGVITILFVVLMMLGLATWTVYAYRNPHTFSGQMLIRYRPSQWRWRRGEARYTAATIHM